MSIGLQDTKLLWGRAGGICTVCKIKVSEEKKTSNEAFPFGEQAHIVAEEEDGPRGKSCLTLQQRNSYPNLILLCPTCHTKVDKAPDEYPVELLHQFKSEHELWFEKNRVNAADKSKQAQDYIYAEIIDAATNLCMFEEWEKWTSHTLSTSPAWHEEWAEKIEEYRRRIIRVVWPGRIKELEDALTTLSINLSLALKVFTKHCERSEDGWLREIQFYRLATDGQQQYDRLLKEYEDWLDEHEELMFEATKSANWVADVVRSEINPMFFVSPGKFIVTYGPSSMLRFITSVPEYSKAERKAQPAAALEKLSTVIELGKKRQKELWGD
jgi:hypothetical protein